MEEDRGQMARPTHEGGGFPSFQYAIPKLQSDIELIHMIVESD